MAFQPGFKERVTVVAVAPPATAVRVGVTVGVDVTVGVAVGVYVWVAVAVPVGIAVGQVGAVEAAAPYGVGVAVVDAGAKVTKRLKTTMPPGTFGDVTVMSITPDPELADDRATKVVAPFAPVVPHGDEIEMEFVPDALTEYVAPFRGAFAQSTAATVIAVPTEFGSEIGVGLAPITAVPADGLIPIVIPDVFRSSSDRSEPTYPVSDEARDPFRENESVVTVRTLVATASDAGFSRTVATRTYPFGPEEPKFAPASYRACPRVLSMEVSRGIGNGFEPPPVGAPYETT
jgi:hypothetical protein